MILAFIRLVLIAKMTIFFTVVILISNALRFNQMQRLLRGWGKTLTWLFGLEVKVQGQFPDINGILICNHRSYTDIPIIMGYQACVFLAKAELERAPIIGWAGRMVKTIFVKRESVESRKKAKEELVNRLKLGYSVMVFAEGTTVKQFELLPLKPGMLQSAIEGQFPVIPLFLEFEDEALAWYGDMDMGKHFFRCFCRWKNTVYLRIGTPITHHCQVNAPQNISQNDSEKQALEKGIALKNEVEAWMKSQILAIKQELQSVKQDQSSNQ